MLFQYINTICGDVFFYLFILSSILLITSIILLFKTIKINNKKFILQEKQYISQINKIKKEHNNMLNNLRIDMVKHENERVRQWMESEKETLHVLNGVSTLLELSDRVDKSEFKNINEKLELIEKFIKNK